MKFFRIFLAAALILALSLSLLSCKGSEETETKTAEAGTAAVKTGEKAPSTGEVSTGEYNIEEGLETPPIFR